MCKVDLSEVQASSVPDGLNPSEKIVAVSMPRRSSATRPQLLVAKTRMRVPCQCQSEGNNANSMVRDETYRIARRSQQLAVWAQL
jgi:hypothetical protein